MHHASSKSLPTVANPGAWWKRIEGRCQGDLCGDNGANGQVNSYRLSIDYLDQSAAPNEARTDRALGLVVNSVTTTSGYAFAPPLTFPI